MIRWFRRYRKIFWVGIILAMLLSIVGAGGFYFTSKDFSESVAVVGKVKISYMYYRRIVDRTMEQLRKDHKDVTDAEAKEVQMTVLRQLITTQICAMEAEALGLRISDEQLAATIAAEPQFQSNGVFNQALYIQTVVQALGMTVDDFEADLRTQLAASKYQTFVFNVVKLSDADILDEYKQSHNGSDKNFAKDREKFADGLYRIRTYAALQSSVTHAANRIGVRSFLEAREQGVGG